MEELAWGIAWGLRDDAVMGQRMIPIFNAVTVFIQVAQWLSQWKMAPVERNAMLVPTWVARMLKAAEDKIPGVDPKALELVGVGVLASEMGKHVEVEGSSALEEENNATAIELCLVRCATATFVSKWTATGTGPQ